MGWNQAAGRLDALGEVGSQYEGIAPNDARMEPIYALAEELDLPLGLHMHPGPPGATAIGYPVYRYQLLCFVISGAIAGLAGALIANQTGYVGPALLHWIQSGTLMIMVILGGVGRFWGGPVGAAVLLTLEEIFSGSPVLGTWQAIYLIEHRDRPHIREIVLHYLGTRGR